MTVADVLPPRLPVQEPGDYRWAARGWTDDAHAFPPVEAGHLPGPAPCGVRWNVAFAWEGGAKCSTCIAQLRDQLRAVSVALAAAGIRLDRAEPVADPGDHFRYPRVVTGGAPDPAVDVIDPRDGGRNER